MSKVRGGNFDTTLHTFSSGDTKKNVFYWGGSRRRSASLRRADAAQVCSHVGVLEEDGPLKCCYATTARQIVSERWREAGGPKHLSLTARSAFDSTRRRETSPVVANQQRRHEHRKHKQIRQALARSRQGGSASFWRADAEQVCNDVVADGRVKCSEVATAARRIVSERW